MKLLSCWSSLYRGPKSTTITNLHTFEKKLKIWVLANVPIDANKLYFTFVKLQAKSLVIMTINDNHNDRPHQKRVIAGKLGS